jgi:hypothetical protein
MQSPQTRHFHLGDILSITHGRLVSPRHMDGIYDILGFMTRDDLYTHQLPRAMKECKPWLLRQHPQLDTPEVTLAVAELGEMLDTPWGEAKPDMVVAEWLASMVARYGNIFPVEPIPMDDHDRIDPIEEARRLKPDAEIVVVKLSATD